MGKLEFASKMRERMKRSRLRVIDIARESGLPQPRVSQYATGTRRPSFETVVILARALDWPLQDALHAAGRHDPAASNTQDADIRLAQRLGPIIGRAEPAKRGQIEEALAEMAERMVNFLGDNRASISEPENVHIITDYADVGNRRASRNSQTLQTVASAPVSRYLQ